MRVEQSFSAYTDANPYDFDNRITLHEYPNMILERLKGGGINPGESKLLELGLGHGYSALVFKEHFIDYTILDGDSEIIDSFQKKNPNNGINIVHTFFEDYKAEHKYDIIVVGFVLEHVVDPKMILELYRTYLSDNGKMYIAVPNAEALNRRLGFEAGLLKDLGQLSETDIKLGHKRYFTVNTITKLCKNVGLKITAIEGIYLKPFTTKQILSLNLDDSIIAAMCKIGREYPELCLGILLECEL